MLQLHPIFEQILAAHGMPQRSAVLDAVDRRRADRRQDEATALLFQADRRHNTERRFVHADVAQCDCCQRPRTGCSLVLYHGNETYACPECRGVEDDRADTWREDAKRDAHDERKDRAESYSAGGFGL